MDYRDLIVEDEMFDPLAQDEVALLAPESADEEPEMPLIGEPLEQRAALEPDTRTPRERIDALLAEMPGHRRLLLRLIDYCREAKTGEEMDAKTEELLRYGFSVYSPVVLRELLEEAGAIFYWCAQDFPEDAAALGYAPDAGDAAAGDGVSADGTEEAAESEPSEESELQSITLAAGEDEVELEFREIEQREPGFWQATVDGLDVVDAQDDRKRVDDLLGREPQYKTVYQQIMDACTQEGGRSAKELDNLVNDNPLLENPRRYSGYFVGRLEREGAIEWAGGWVLTPTGKQVLNTMLAEAAEAAEVATL